MSPADIEAAREALERLAGEIARLEVVAEGWDASHAQTLAAIKSSIEALDAEAFRRLIRCLKEDPAAAARLDAAVRDPLVFGVLRLHGLVKDPLEHRVERALEDAASQPIHFVSSFAKPPERESWIWMCTVKHIPDGGVVKITHWGRNFLLHRQGDAVSCMTNACPHRGMPIDSGRVANGVITCPYHDYEFDLQTGRCLNVSEDPLTMHAVRVNDGHVEVRLPL
ncbi:MAG TPA: Rieske 2Fe-2S domain-containing protein [Burkholderiales bacterium]|nr:Rieske 2Fe-2S domain-containing protein [Burkholderiales bacterium]